MGQNAVYIAVDDATAEELWSLEDEPFRSRFMDLEEDSTRPRLDIGKIWDALHCTLTGVPASEPVEDDKLSEAIVGVHPKIYDDEDYSLFVSIIDNDELSEIISAISEYTAEKLKQCLDPELLCRQGVYPQGIWEMDPGELVKEMDESLASIRAFFVQSEADGLHVLATIL